MNAAADPVPQTPHVRPRILLRGADAALAALLSEWLGDIAELQLDADAAAPVPAATGAGPDPHRADLHIVDVPFPRRDHHPPRDTAAGRAVPVLVLSPTFLGTIDCHGPVAAALGVDGVLPKPVPREALLAAVRRLLARTGGAP